MTMQDRVLIAQKLPFAHVPRITNSIPKASGEVLPDQPFHPIIVPKGTRDYPVLPRIAGLSRSPAYIPLR